MIVAVVAVRMVQVAVDEVIHMVAVGYCRGTALGVMHMTLVMARASVGRGADIRVRRGHRDDVFVNMVAVRMMEVPVMQVVYVAFVLDCDVAAVRAVLVWVVGMVRMGAGGHVGSK